MLKRTSRATLILAFASLCAPVASADDYSAAARVYVSANIAGWAASPVLLNAVRAQNMRTADLEQTQIIELDQAWRAEVGTRNNPTISAMLTNPASQFLEQQVLAAGGAITEIILMDANGLNVAVSSVTSDMWQGDEAKFTETYPNGQDGLHVGDIELDESTNTYSAQVSFTITDPETQTPIGAMTVGIRAEELL